MNEKSTPPVLKICNICIFIFDCIINIATAPFILVLTSIFDFIEFSTMMGIIYFLILVIVTSSIIGLIHSRKNKINRFNFFYIIYIIKTIIGHPLLILWILSLFADI